MGSSSDEDDGDYVPEGDDRLFFSNCSGNNDLNSRSVTTDSCVDALWEAMNAPTAVSAEATQRSARLLRGLTQRTTSAQDEKKKKTTKKKTTTKKKKRKLHEFSMPVLSVDVKRSRTDLALAAKQEKVERVVKFAGKEYSVRTSAAAEEKDRKGLDKVLEALDEPKKVSTMEKTSLDWDRFKEDEGIDEELTQYTKDGCVLALRTARKWGRGWLMAVVLVCAADTLRSRSSCSGSTSNASRLKRLSGRSNGNDSSCSRSRGVGGGLRRN
ncbi:unnamed protein product [Phytophthora fragariaefolia]|uniref:Unnamed protein product n=1 Tax=Phytophthora fragariaefolia TaxID=1490495 RepID=A0A9W6XX38_9STRA|nr:unnamed protein product [Phytophthora fragariaefolia]